MTKPSVASNAASIHLMKFGIVPEDDDNHLFTFVFENPQKLLDVKSIESSEVNYGGQRWSLVCMRKDDRFMGIFLKWKYADGQSAASISSRTKYSICLVHRHDYSCNKYFNSSQKFTSSQSLLGKSKFIPLSDLLDYATGYLDETGKRVILELSLSRSSTRSVCHSGAVTLSKLHQVSLSRQLDVPALQKVHQVSLSSNSRALVLPKLHQVSISLLDCTRHGKMTHF